MYVNCQYQEINGQWVLVKRAYVEYLKPAVKASSTPIVLIHGDYHTSDVSRAPFLAVTAG